jgi:hypothetical protein
MNIGEEYGMEKVWKKKVKINEVSGDKRKIIIGEREKRVEDIISNIEF